MAKNVTVGSDKGFFNATTGDTGDGIHLQLGTGLSEYDVEKNRAEAATEAFIGGIGSQEWAEVGTKFAVDGDHEREATISIKGDYRMNLTASTLVLGAATARVRAQVFVRDVTPEKEKDEENNVFRDNTAVLLHSQDLTPENDPDNDYPDVPGFEEKVVDTFKPGNTYIAGVRADAWATADVLATSSADIYSENETGSFDGYIEYDRILIDWN